jgi:phosphate/sulfate permease
VLPAMKKKPEGGDAGSDEEKEEARASSICSVAFRLSDKSALQRTHTVYVLLFVSPDFLTVFTALFFFFVFTRFVKSTSAYVVGPFISGTGKEKEEKKKRKRRRLKEEKRFIFRFYCAFLIFYLTGSNPVFRFFFFFFSKFVR